MDQLSYSLHGHLPHHTSTVDLDGLLGRTEFTGNLLVQHPGDDEIEDVSFTGRQCLQASMSRLYRGTDPTALAIDLKSFCDPVQQFLILEGFRKEIDGASFHGFYAGRNVTVAGHEDDRDLHASPGQLLLKFQAVQTRHMHIKNQAGRPIWEFYIQKGLGRFEELNFEARRFDKAPESLAHGCVVIYNENDWIHSAHGS